MACLDLRIRNGGLKRFLMACHLFPPMETLSLAICVCLQPAFFSSLILSPPISSHRFESVHSHHKSSHSFEFDHSHHQSYRSCEFDHSHHQSYRSFEFDHSHHVALSLITVTTKLAVTLYLIIGTASSLITMDLNATGRSSVGLYLNVIAICNIRGSDKFLWPSGRST